MNRVQTPIRRAVAIVFVSLVAAAVACGDDGVGMTEPDPDRNPAKKDPMVASVEVTPASVALSSVGSTTELAAVAKDEEGRVMESARIVWQSSDPSVVVVDSIGRVVSKGPGSAVVAAVAGGIPGYVPVTVTQTAASLAFLTQPADGVAGAALSPAIQVEIRDEAGQRVNGATDAVTLSLVGGAEGDELTGTRTVNAIDGVASFSGLAVERADSGLTVRASAGELESAESAEFGIAPGAPARLAFLAVPEEGVAGDTFDVRVAVRDAFGNPVPTATGRVALSLGAAPEGARPGGALEADAEAGVATFEVVLERADSGYTVTAAASGLEGAESEPFRILPAAPDRLAFIEAPDSVHVGVVHTYRVGVEDAFGNRVHGVDSVRVTIENDTLMIVDGELSYAHAFMVPRFAMLVAISPDLSLGSARVEPTVILEWRQVVSGHDRSCGISVYAILYCWGNGARGRLGTSWGPNDQPSPVAGNRRWRAVAVGREHTCAIEVGGTAYCWGANGHGQLGVNDAATEFVTQPTKVDTNLRFSEIATGEYHTCGVTTGSRVLCWGRNDHGQLGSTGGDAIAPRPIDSDLEFRRVTAGANHTCALRGPSVIRGHAYCWGNNAFGQLGNRNRTSTATPDSVIRARQFRSITAGSDHTCGIDDPHPFPPGAVLCWGSNAQGQLGVGTGVAMDSVPRSIGFHGFEARALTAGESHTCMLTADASYAYCWGGNMYGQLGTGTTTDQVYAAAVVGSRAFSAISGGGRHSCAVALDGNAYCWGSDQYGQLGTIADEPSFVPVPVQP